MSVIPVLTISVFGFVDMQEKQTREVNMMKSVFKEKGIS
jgi:hypothetical protein